MRKFFSKNIIISCLLLLSGHIYAQQFNVTMSESFTSVGTKPILKVANEYFLIDISTPPQYATFNLNKTKHRVRLIKFDSKMASEKESMLAGGEKVYGPFEPMLRLVDDKLYFLYFETPGKDEDIKLMASEVDKSSLNLAAPIEILSIQQSDINSKKGETFYESTFILTRSPDHSKLLALWYSGTNDRVIYSVMDKVKRIRTSNDGLPGADKFRLNNACIDNTGTIYIAYAFGYHDDETAYVYVGKADTKGTGIRMRVDGGLASDVYIEVLPSGRVVLGGIYKEGTPYLAGVFFQTLNPVDVTLGTQTKTPFPEVLVAQFANDSWGSTRPKYYGLNQGEIIFKPYLLADGSLDIVGEFRRREYGTNIVADISGGLLNVHFTSTGAVMSRIPKGRVSAGSTVGDSYYAFPYKNEMILFYDDHQANVMQDITKAPSRSDNYRNSVLVAATVNTDGSVKRDIVADLNKEDYLAITDNIQELSSSSLLVPFNHIKGLGKVADEVKLASIEIK